MFGRIRVWYSALVRKPHLPGLEKIVGGVSNPDWTGFAQEIGVRNPSNNRKMGLGNH